MKVKSCTITAVIIYRCYPEPVATQMRTRGLTQARLRWVQITKTNNKKTVSNLHHLQYEGASQLFCLVQVQEELSHGRIALHHDAFHYIHHFKQVSWHEQK